MFRTFTSFLHVNFKIGIYALIFAFPVSLSIALGITFELDGRCLPFHLKSTLIFLLLFSLLFSLFIYLNGVKHASAHGVTKFDIKEKMAQNYGSLKLFFLFFIFLQICWSPYLFATFPGLYVYDAIPQTTSAISLGIIDTWHPLFHTFWMSGLMELGKNYFNSYSLGFALYTVSQYFLFSLQLAYFLAKLRDLGVCKFYLVLSLLFFALFPVFPIMAVSSTKDTIFSSSLALFVVELVVISANRDDKNDWVIFFVSCLLVSCLRNNGFYAVAVVLLIMTVIRHKDIFNVLFFIITLAFCILLSVILPKLLSDRSSGPGEMLAIPIQQVSRTAKNHYSQLSGAEKEQLDNSLPGWNEYLPSIVDPVKFYSNADSALKENIDDFAHLWIRLLFKYPGDYLDATVALIKNWINPFSNYDGLDTGHPYLEYDSYYILEDGVLVRHYLTGDNYLAYSTDNVIEVFPHSLLPIFEMTVRNICYKPIWETSTVFRALFSPATVIIALYFCFISDLFKRRCPNIMSYIFLGLYFVTCLLGPTFLIRYSLPFFIVSPLLSYYLGKTSSNN